MTTPTPTPHPPAPENSDSEQTGFFRRVRQGFQEPPEKPSHPSEAEEIVIMDDEGDDKTAGDGDSDT